MTKRREYYSRRTIGSAAMSLSAFRKLLIDAWDEFFYPAGTFDPEYPDYLEQAVGYWCHENEFADAKLVPGFMSRDPGRWVLQRTEKDNLWWPDRDRDYSEDDLFDLLELTHDIVSKPVSSSLDHCCPVPCSGRHTQFDQAQGQADFRDKVNPVLERYGDGYRLTEAGFVLAVGGLGMDGLLDGELLPVDQRNVDELVEAAVLKFRHHHASEEDKRESVRALADVLEYLHPTAKAGSRRNADESALFDIANNFRIRHHNARQKTDYDAAVWLDWVFYVYLATCHAWVRVIHRNDSRQA